MNLPKMNRILEARWRKTSAALFCWLAAGGLAVASGCAWMPFIGDDEDDLETETSEQALYRRAQAGLRTGNFTQSITRLQRLEARFPFGRYAEQAQLELIYANHMARDLDAAEAAAERFIRLHPQHPNVDYAYYMKGITALARDRGATGRFMKTELSQRDVSNLQQAFADFNDLIRQFPNSEFAKDAQQRMVYLRNVLAASEVHIASYYLGRGAFVAAANRARHVVENYSQTPAAPDALAVLVEANWKLGLKEAAEDALQVLALNFPDYRGFDKDGKLVLKNVVENRRRTWLNMVSFGLLSRPDAPPPLEIPRPRSAAQGPT